MTIGVGGANYVKERKARPPRVQTEDSMQTRAAAAPQQASVAASGTREKPVAPAAPLAPAASADAQAALALTQQSILTLQKMQEQTAQLHKQYLEGQQVAQQNLQQLLQQQQQMLNGGHAITSATVTTPVTTPVTGAPVSVSSDALVAWNPLPAVRQLQWHRHLQRSQHHPGE